MGNDEENTGLIKSSSGPSNANTGMKYDVNILTILTNNSFI